LIRKLGIRNVSIIHADGNNGYLNSAPFDAIILSAAIEEAPINLLDTQLASNGVFIGPIGKTTQVLTKIIKKRSKLYQEELEAVNFVPFLPGVIHD
jgi:protein-L-isoaspartate(D-aspartate) O-methyltransferase